MAWQELGGANTGQPNNAIDATIHWLGTRDNDPLIIRTENGPLGMNNIPNPAAEVMRITPVTGLPPGTQPRGVGIGTTTPRRKLHVEPSEIHSGGSAAGFSFGNRLDPETGLPAPFTETPTINGGVGGERWVWYASEGTARLWSGTDQLSITPAGNLSAARRVSAGTDVRARQDVQAFQDVRASRDVRAVRNVTGKYGEFDSTFNPDPFLPTVRVTNDSTIGVRSFTRSGSTAVLGASLGASDTRGVMGAATSTGVGVQGQNMENLQSVNPGTGFGGWFFGPGVAENPLPPFGDRGGLRVRGHFFVVEGIKSAVVPHPDGSHRLLHSLESPESWFEDFGRAEITGGRGWVDLDPDFAAVVETEDYHVFFTPEGDSNGLYVSRRGPESFEVREQQDGTSNLTLSYRVVARRKDVKTERLAKMELPEDPPMTFSEEDFEQLMRGTPPPEPTQPEGEAES